MEFRSPSAFSAMAAGLRCEGLGAGEDTELGVGLRCAHQGSDAPSSLKGIGDQPQGV